MASKVFISYRQTNSAQKAQVLAFGQSLKDAGIEVVLDQFMLKATPGGSGHTWPVWSNTQAKNADHIIMIGTLEWFQCFEKKQPPGTGLGAAGEAHIIYQRLNDDSWINPNFRVVYFDNAQRKHAPLELKGFHHLHAVNDLSEIVAWLGGSIPPSAPPSPLFSWPIKPVPYLPDMANRSEEFSFFVSTLTSSSPKRGTLISAESGRGKTALVKTCYSYAKDVIGHQRCARIDFKGINTTQFFYDSLKADLGGRFSTCGEADVVSCLRTAPEPVLILVDHYENATDEARSHVESLILGNLERSPNVRLLLTGQPKNFPRTTGSKWEDDVRTYELDVITDVDCWIDWTRRRGYDLVTDDMVRTLVVTGHGNPSTISANIQLLAGKSATFLKNVGYTHVTP